MSTACLFKYLNIETYYIQWKLDLAELDLAKKLDLANNLGTPEFLLSKIHSI